MGKFVSKDDDKYFVEKVFPKQVYCAYKVKEEICTSSTEFQDMKFIEFERLKKCLLLDGYLQSSEVDEKEYHEVLVHPSMFSHPNPRNVFIGGGGEGATAREVLKHNTVEKVTMCDIDEKLVNFCKENMKYMNSGAFDDPRMNLIIMDAVQYLKEYDPEKEGYFDVMIMDFVDLQSDCVSLYTKEFFEMCRTKLDKTHGILVTQASECSVLAGAKECALIRNTLKSVFPSVEIFRKNIPTFFSMWGFIICSLKNDINFKEIDVEKLIKNRIVGGEKSLSVYDMDTHIHCFHNPKRIKEMMRLETRIITEKNYEFLEKENIC